MLVAVAVGVGVLVNIGVEVCVGVAVGVWDGVVDGNGVGVAGAVGRAVDVAVADGVPVVATSVYGLIKRTLAHPMSVSATLPAARISAVMYERVGNLYLHVDGVQHAHETFVIVLEQARYFARCSFQPG